MKTLISKSVVLVFTWFFLFPGSSNAQSYEEKGLPKVVLGQELIVRFKDDVSLSAANRNVGKLGFRQVKQIST